MLSNPLFLSDNKNMNEIKDTITYLESKDKNYIFTYLDKERVTISHFCLDIYNTLQDMDGEAILRAMFNLAEDDEPFLIDHFGLPSVIL